MTWNHDITKAPRGKTITFTRKVKTANGLVDRSFEETRREFILAVHADGMVVQSYWVPPKHTQSGALLEGNRWSGFNVGSDPIAWAEWPVFNSQSDGGEFAAVKAQGRLADPVGVEPSPTGLDHFILEDVGSGA